MKTTSAFFAIANAITSLVVVPRSEAASAADVSAAMRPFTVPTAPHAALDDLRRRIAATRWPE
jgi:hypothetical protein